MARPRKPPAPSLYLPCPRCQLEYEPVVRWPDGAICGYCYQQAKRTRGTCATCGHIGVLPGRTPTGENTCRRCSGIRINVDCVECGTEDELYRAGLCWRCTLGKHVDRVLAGDDGSIKPALLPLADALKQMSRPNSGLTWIRQQPVDDLLKRLARGEVAISHAAFDDLPRSKVTEFLRELLVEHQVLPRRDRNLAAFELWLRDKLTTIDDIEHRKIIERFGRWHHLRRLRIASASKPISLSALMNAKQTTTVAINFLAWLGEQGVELSEVTQAEIDAWHADGPSTNGRVDTFLFWTKSNRIVSRLLDVPRHHRGNGPILERRARIDAIRHLLVDDQMLLPNRVAAGLVLLYGQPVHRVAATRVECVTLREDGATIRFARDDLGVPEPFATLLSALCQSRANLQTAAHRDSPWLFPGYVPGEHINALHLAEELRQHGAPPLAGRAGAWQQLVRELDPVILADAIGISPTTAMKHAERAGTSYQRYAGSRATRSMSSEAAKQ